MTAMKTEITDHGLLTSTSGFVEYRLYRCLMEDEAAEERDIPAKVAEMCVKLANSARENHKRTFRFEVDIDNLNLRVMGIATDGDAPSSVVGAYSAMSRMRKPEEP